MKYFLAFFGAITAISTLILAILKRNPQVVNPKIKKALELREEINEQANRQILKLQERRIEQLESELNRLHDKLESILWMQQKNSPPTR